MAERLTDTSSPTVPELCKALKEVKEWEKLGINLKDMKYCVIKEIKEDEKTLETRKMEIFSRWLKLCPNASWENVVAALEEINENTIAKEVTDKYITGKDTGISSMAQVDDTSTTVTDYSVEPQMESPPVSPPEPETGGESHGVPLILKKQRRSQSTPDHTQGIQKTEKERFFEMYHTESELKKAWVKECEMKDRELEELRERTDYEIQKLQADQKTQVKKIEKLEQQVTNIRQENNYLKQQLYNTKQELKQRSETEQELKHVQQELQEAEYKMRSKDTKQGQELQNIKRELEETKMQWVADNKKLKAKLNLQNNELKQQVELEKKRLEQRDRDSKQELYRIKKELKESRRELEQRNRESKQELDRARKELKERKSVLEQRNRESKQELECVRKELKESKSELEQRNKESKKELDCVRKELHKSRRQLLFNFIGFFLLVSVSIIIN